MAEFLNACITGDVEKLQDFKTSGFDMQTYDAEGLNGLHLAIVNGNWKILQFLLEELEISPNRITNSGDSLYHTMIKSINTHAPTAEDWSELKSACVNKWDEVERVANEQEATK